VYPAGIITLSGAAFKFYFLAWFDFFALNSVTVITANVVLRYADGLCEV